MDSVKLDSYGFAHFRVPAVIKWTPQEDITPFELAQTMPILFGLFRTSFPEDAIRAMPANIQRHFTIEEQGVQT